MVEYLNIDININLSDKMFLFSVSLYSIAVENDDWKRNVK